MRVPLLRALREAGSSDPRMDAFVVAGPLVIGLIAVVGRTWPTEALAVLYVLTFLGYVGYKGVARARNYPHSE